MTIWVIFGLIAIALYYFYAYNRSNRLRKEERREEANNKRQELLEKTIQAKKNADFKKESDKISDSNLPNQEDV